MIWRQRGLNMDSKYKIYIKRTINEMNLSKMIMRIREEDNIQEEIFNMPFDTYFSAVISHAYYSIFYMARRTFSQKK